MLRPFPISESQEVRRIRELLLTQYIGAIVIGLLIESAINNFVSAVVLPIVLYIESLGSMPGRLETEHFLFWGRLIGSLLSVVLQAFVAYLLLRWLYLRAPYRQNDREIVEPTGQA